MNYICHYSSPLGPITIACDGSAITGLWFDDQKYFGSTLSSKYTEQSFPIFDETIHWLDLYFDGKKPDFIPRLKMQTTPFRKTVWEILLDIPYGQTMTYGEIAEKVAYKKGLSIMSAQAIGGAVGHNAISLIIPCHRVIGTAGSLTGYAGGIARKSYLLDLERKTILF